MKGFKEYERMVTEGGLVPGQTIRVSGDYRGMYRTYTYRVVDEKTLDPVRAENLSHLSASPNPRKTLQGREWEIIE